MVENNRTRCFVCFLCRARFSPIKTRKPPSPFGPGGFFTIGAERSRRRESNSRALGTGQRRPRGTTAERKTEGSNPTPRKVPNRLATGGAPVRASSSVAEGRTLEVQTLRSHLLSKQRPRLAVLPSVAASDGIEPLTRSLASPSVFKADCAPLRGTRQSGDLSTRSSHDSRRAMRFPSAARAFRVRSPSLGLRAELAVSSRRR